MSLTRGMLRELREAGAVGAHDFSAGVSLDSVRLAPSLVFGMEVFASWCGCSVQNETIEPLRQQPSNIVALSMGGTRAVPKTGFGRTARFGNCLPVLSHLAALEGSLVRQGTRSDGVNRCHRSAALRTAFAIVLGAGDYCVRTCVFLIS